MSHALGALLLAATALGLTVALELRPAAAPGHAPSPVSPVAAAPVAPRAGGSRPAGSGPSAPELAERRRIALARPLFTPGRRPRAPASVAAAAPEQLPRLSGIVQAPALAVAIFAPAHDGDRSLRLAVGGAVAAWRIARIDSGSVTLVRDGRAVLLRPRFGNAPPPTLTDLIAGVVMMPTKHTNPQLAW